MLLIPGPKAEAASGKPLSARLRKELSSSKLDSATVSLVVYDLDANKEVFAHNAGSLLSIASTLKLLSAAAIVDEFGAGHRFTTEWRAQGFRPLKGEIDKLYVLGSADPSYSRDELRTAVSELKKLGVKRISETRLVNLSFDTDPANPQWTHEDAQYYYGPTLSSLCIDENTVEVVVRIEGGVATMRPPDVVELFGLTSEVTRNGGETDFEFSWNQGAKGGVFTGSFGARRLEKGQKICIPDPLALFGLYLEREFERAGIDCASIVEGDRSGVEGDSLLTQRSAPLEDLLERMLVNSSNFYAETLLHAAAARSADEHGEYDQLDPLFRMLKRWGIKEGDVVLHDGSGLARTNLMSARQLVRVLRGIDDDATLKAAIKPNLGTPPDRLWHLPKSLNGDLLVKTGTMSQCRAMAGYINEPGLKGRRLAFVLILNNFPGKVRGVLSVETGVVNALAGK